MNIEDKTAAYDITPCRLVAYGVPTLSPTVHQVGPKEIEISGFTTMETSVEEAQRRSDGMLKVVFQQLKEGNHQELVNLLDEHPQFIAVPRIRYELGKWVTSGRSYRQPGRPRKGALRHPLIVGGIVGELMSGDLRMNKGDAFARVADWLCISASTARDYYYDARCQERFKPILMRTGPRITTPIEANLGQAIETAELLECGKKVRRTLAHTADGSIVATFSAK